MRDGVIPALKAARTAFSFPDVKATGTNSTCRLRGLLPDAGTFSPRRFCSASTAESNRSRSRSSSRLTVLAKSLGRMCGNEVAVVSLVIGDEDESSSGSEEAPPPEVCENRSRVVDRECALFIQGMTPPSVPRSNRTFCVGYLAQLSGMCGNLRKHPAAHYLELFNWHRQSLQLADCSPAALCQEGRSRSIFQSNNPISIEVAF